MEPQFLNYNLLANSVDLEHYNFKNKKYSSISYLSDMIDNDERKYVKFKTNMNSTISHGSDK